MNRNGLVKGGILGASMNGKEVRKRDVGLLLGVNLRPVDLRVGAGWCGRSRQHNVILLEALPERSKLGGDDLLGLPGLASLPSSLGLGDIVHTSGGKLANRSFITVNVFVTFDWC